MSVRNLTCCIQLVTSSVDGHHFNVYQLGLSPGGGAGGELSYRHLYKLVRGVTHATIQVYFSFSWLCLIQTNYLQDISFSADSKWMAVSTTRGTTHIHMLLLFTYFCHFWRLLNIYAINPQGGAVNVLTHVPAINRPPDLLSPHKPDLPVCIFLNANIMKY